MKNDRLVAAAIMAAALATEAACSDASATKRCTVVDPATHAQRTVTVAVDTPCPPVATTRTVARGATPAVAGWYIYRGTPFYGPLRRGATPATNGQAATLQSQESADEENARASNRASESAARSAGDFGESGSHGGFGG